MENLKTQSPWKQKNVVTMETQKTSAPLKKSTHRHHHHELPIPTSALPSFLTHSVPDFASVTIEINLVF